MFRKLICQVINDIGRENLKKNIRKIVLKSLDMSHTFIGGLKESANS